MNKREWLLQAALTVIGTGREFDIEQTCAALSTTYDAIVAASPEPADEGWIEHRGEKPYPEGRVEVQFRDGKTGDGDADEYVWSHDDFPDVADIVAWRPA